LSACRRNLVQPTLRVARRTKSEGLTSSVYAPPVFDHETGDIQLCQVQVVRPRSRYAGKSHIRRSRRSGICFTLPMSQPLAMRIPLPILAAGWISAAHTYTRQNRAHGRASSKTAGEKDIFHGQHEADGVGAAISQCRREERPTEDSKAEVKKRGASPQGCERGSIYPERPPGTSTNRWGQKRKYAQKTQIKQAVTSCA